MLTLVSTSTVYLVVFKVTDIFMTMLESYVILLQRIAAIVFFSISESEFYCTPAEKYAFFDTLQPGLKFKCSIY